MKPFALCDAHAHPGDEEDFVEREEHSIVSLLCASTPAEAKSLFRRTKQRNRLNSTVSANFTVASTDSAVPSSVLIPTAGLHPWYAADHKVSDMAPYLSACPVIGEIGMDSVWCSTPLPIQEQVFREQLSLAYSLGKPVILHTKGQEKEIASILKEYPNTYLVHWYSCEQFLEDYLALDCYFSVGPDVWWNPTVRRVAETVPLNRLLIETDGMNAVKWAYEEAPDGLAAPLLMQSKTAAVESGAVSGTIAAPGSADSPRRTPFSSAALSLTCTLTETAKIRHLPPEDAGKQIFHNLVHGFLKEDLLPGM